MRAGGVEHKKKHHLGRRVEKLSRGGGPVFLSIETDRVNFDRFDEWPSHPIGRDELARVPAPCSINVNRSVSIASGFVGFHPE